MHNIPPKPQPQPGSVDVHKLKFLMHAVRRRVFRTFWNRLLARLITSLTSLYSLCQKSRQSKPSIKSLPLSNLTKQSQICGSDEGLPLFCQPDQGWVHCGSAPMRWGCKTCDYSTSPLMLFLQKRGVSIKFRNVWNLRVRTHFTLSNMTDKERKLSSVNFLPLFIQTCQAQNATMKHTINRVNFATFGWRLFRYLDTRLSADWPRLPPWLGMDR